MIYFQTLKKAKEDTISSLFQLTHFFFLCSSSFPFPSLLLFLFFLFSPKILLFTHPFFFFIYLCAYVFVCHDTVNRYCNREQGQMIRTELELGVRGVALLLAMCGCSGLWLYYFTTKNFCLKLFKWPSCLFWIK